MAGYIGTQPVPQATQSRDSFTATGGQTTFATAGYQPGYIDVYLNGVHLVDVTDYTATNGSDVVLASGASINDIVEVVAYSTFEVLNQTLTGTTTVDVLNVTGAFTSLGIDDNATSTAITLSSGGNVGIGTASPTFTAAYGGLHIHSTYPELHMTGTDSGSGAGDGFKIQKNSANHVYLWNYENAFMAFGTNNTERLRIDSSGNVGIGTSSPDVNLSVFGSTAVGADVGGEISIGGFYDGSSKTSYGSIAGVNQNGTGNTSGQLLFKTRTNFGSLTERMRIDSSGNVGIGTSSPSGALHISRSDDARLKLTDTGDSCTFMVRSDGANTSIGTDTAHPVRFMTNNTEAMRLDSSGNLLVGTTSTTPAVSNDSDGIALQANGTVQFSANNTTTAIINRKSTDGTILQFRKDGTTVGSIGTYGGASYYGGPSGGLMFNGVNINPTNGTATRVDATNDIGAGAYRFKDLYLSGGVYLGGTGAANKLDDYEEGTFTPTLDFGSGNTGITYNSQTGKYVKVGSLVSVWIYIALSNKGTSTGQASIGGLPFTINTPAGVFSPLGDRGRINTGGRGVSVYIASGAAFPLYSGGFNGTVNGPVTDGSFQNSSELDIVTSYFTNA